MAYIIELPMFHKVYYMGSLLRMSAVMCFWKWKTLESHLGIGIMPFMFYGKPADHWDET